VIGIVVDQMCYDYLYRFQPKFSSKGFTKLMQEGTNCRNTQYSYVPTYTGPGHASIYTGTTPSNHGIVGNDWYNRSTKKMMNCVADETVQTIGSDSKEGKCSPTHMKTTTITDQLKMTYPSAKVVSVSIKDRGAILPGGHLSDGSYWYDYATGQFITSSYFKNKLPNWVEDFNAKKSVDTYMEKTWETLLPIEKYTESGPDDSPYEVIYAPKKTATFPYDLKEIGNKTGKYTVFTSTPYANTYLTDFALNALKSEKLGSDNQTDFLCISYSTPDIAGHAFGPYSVEIEDIYLRLDLEIERLLNTLDATVGKDQYTLFLTADHAVVPVPQYLIDKKLPGGYFYMDELNQRLATKLTEKYGENLVEENENLNIYLNKKRLVSLKLAQAEVAKFVANEIAQFDHVKAVYTADELLDAPTTNEWKAMLEKGYNNKESGDVLFILEPGYLPKSKESTNSHKGTSHGSAFNYDTHVPLIWYGKNIPKQEINRKIAITDISATLTNILFLQRSGAMTGEPILELFH
jgi:arylsulfatase A-like enzyme